jgi:phenylacetate-CoA ligase
VAPGETGRIVITDLHNAATPFIRYEIGDHGVMAPPEERCPCGRPFPLLRSVEGRLQDKVYTPDGGSVTALFVTYTMRQFDDWIEGWQVVQPSRNAITVRVLTGAELTDERMKPVDEMLRTQLGGELEIDYERVDALERRKGGKIALVQTLFDVEA